jgi:V/A-type H+-transporting ATPase subunit D
MPAREIIPTHSAYLELKAERGGMQEGYRFLDEKRLILASEILAVLKDYEATQARWESARQTALIAVRGALGRHGLEELAVYPSALPPQCRPRITTRSVLGVRIEEVDGDAVPDAVLDQGTQRDQRQGPLQAINPSPEAERCRSAFAPLVPLAARLAILTGNLERLRSEYIRTARRARALEDVLLPEIDDTLREIDTALEELEREEAVRVRRAGR